MIITEEAGRILSSLGASPYVADPDESRRVAERAGIKSGTMKNLDSYEKADLEEALKGSMTVSMGNDTRTVDIPFYISRDSLKGQIFQASKLLPVSEETQDVYADCRGFLDNISVFTRWYSFETGINNKFGNYMPGYF